MSRRSSRSARVLAVLGYHKIGAPPAHGWDSWFYIPEATFAEQLAYLRANAWEVIDVHTLLRGLEAPDLLPERAALLTFDDGYRSNLEIALPWLRRFGYPAVIFVPSGFIGGMNTFDLGAEPDEPICSWSELQELERHGVSVQSHAVTHRRFSELTPSEQEAELRRSKAEIEAGLGRTVEAFSFPFGDDGGSGPGLPAMMRRAGYRTAFLYGGGPNLLPVADRYRLTRLAMGPDTELQALLAEEASAS